MTNSPKRILLKVSGELLGGEQGRGIDSEIARYLAADVKAVQEQGVQVLIVTGGGNFYRGRDKDSDVALSVGDRMGMLGSVMSAMGLASACNTNGVPAVAMSAVEVPQFVKTFRVESAESALKAGKVVMLGGGSATPGFTTDTAGVAFAHMLECDLLLKGTSVDGVYDKNPREHEDAVRLETVTYDEALKQELHVMDMTAFALARDKQLPMVVFDVTKPGQLQRALSGSIGTRVEAN